MSAGRLITNEWGRLQKGSKESRVDAVLARPLRLEAAQAKEHQDKNAASARTARVKKKRAAFADAGKEKEICAEAGEGT